MIKNRKIQWNIDDKFHISSPVVRNIIFKKKINNRKAFCNWIDKISRRYIKDLDWWLTIPSSRNPYISDLFDSICILETLELLLKKNYIIEIKTSSESLIEILQKTQIIKKENLKIYFTKKKSKPEFLILFKNIIFYSIIYFYIKFFSKKINLSKKNNILVESYSLLNFKNKESFNKNILKLNNKNLFLVPNFLPQKKLNLIFRTIKNINNKKHVFREHYLSYSDLFYSFFHFFRKKKFITKHQSFRHWDLSPIINNEIKSYKNYYSAILGMANYRFFKNLKKKNIHLSKLISLFENHAVSRGWCYGARKVFPKIENIGYQGYINFSQYMNSHPCSYEDKAKILPTKLAVISKLFMKNKREFFSKIKVILAPAINLKINNKKIKKNNKNIISLVLTGIKEIDQKLISWTLKFVLENLSIKLIIKFHPILGPESFDKHLINNLKNRVKISKQDIGSLLDRSKIVVSTGPTSAIFQAILKKCYLMIPVFDPWDKLNLEYCKIPKENYVLAFNYKEFRFNLRNMIKNKDKKKLKIVKNRYILNTINLKNTKIFQ